jgi:hypothetical protein
MRIAALAAVALLAPLEVPAAEVEPQTGPPHWSIGAGVVTFVFGDGLLFSSGNGFPGVQASLERRIGRATWLVVGMAGSFQTEDADPTPSGTALLLSGADAEGWRGSGAAGLRRELTGATAPFVVSGLLLANVGGMSLERAFVTGSPAEEVREETEGVTAGLTAGVAVDRELTHGLSVRVSSSLLAASWSWTEIRYPGAPVRDARTFRVGLAIAPTLELRLAF